MPRLTARVQVPCMCAVGCVLGVLTLFACAKPGVPAGAGQATDTVAHAIGPHATTTILGDAYYLDTCAVCEQRLGAGGETIDRSYDGRNVRFCTSRCQERFEFDSAGALARLDERMIADQLPLYPLGTSIVSGDALPEHRIDFIFSNRLFRVRDQSERDTVRRNPEHYWRFLDEAVLAHQRPDYAMPGRCPVQGDILSSDTPIDIVVANRMIRVCCVRCVRLVRARPSQYLSMVDYARRAAREEASRATD